MGKFKNISYEAKVNFKDDLKSTEGLTEIFKNLMEKLQQNYSA